MALRRWNLGRAVSQSQGLNAILEGVFGLRQAIGFV
jgi:hypothetical protein